MRNQKIQQALLSQSIESVENTNNFWDKSEITKKNKVFLKERTDIQNMVISKPLDIQKPNMFQHQLVKGKKKNQVLAGNDRISPDVEPSQRTSPELINVADSEVEKVTKKQVSKKVSQINADK